MTVLAKLHLKNSAIGYLCGRGGTVRKCERGIKRRERYEKLH